VKSTTIKKTAKVGALAVACLVVLALGAAFLLPSCIAAEREVALEVVRQDVPGPPTPARATLKVMTLNVAHGCKSQRFSKRAYVESCLNGIAEVLKRERPDVVALQEADGPSVWSGGFDHVVTLAKATQFPFRVHGRHVDGMKLAYGTALLSAVPLEDAFSFRFDLSRPTFPKGFVLATIRWPGQNAVKMDVVSAHLDFSRASVRTAQVQEMVARLSGRGRPLIVMGDFNCQWTDDEPALRRLVEGLNLKPFRPDAGELGTFIASGKRLDWILISPELEFATCSVLPDTVSDHRPVVAVLRLAGKPLE